jgi:hypothetical protein
LKAWFQPEHHRHHRFYLFYLSYFYLPVMHIILYIYVCLPSLPFLLGVSHILTTGNHCF